MLRRSDGLISTGCARGGTAPAAAATGGEGPLLERLAPDAAIPADSALLCCNEKLFSLLLRLAQATGACRPLSTGLALGVRADTDAAVGDAPVAAAALAA